MATEQKAGGNQQNQQTSAGNQGAGPAERVLAKYHELKEHAEKYPYVWASYAVVYGGFGLWFTYRWRKLRKTEDRVRALQERLRKLAQADESASSSSSASAISEKPSGATHVDKQPKWFLRSFWLFE